MDTPGIEAVRSAARSSGDQTGHPTRTYPRASRWTARGRAHGGPAVRCAGPRAQAAGRASCRQRTRSPGSSPRPRGRPGRQVATFAVSTAGPRDTPARGGVSCGPPGRRWGVEALPVRRGRAGIRPPRSLRPSASPLPPPGPLIPGESSRSDRHGRLRPPFTETEEGAAHANLLGHSGRAPGRHPGALQPGVVADGVPGPELPVPPRLRTVPAGRQRLCAVRRGRRAGRRWTASESGGRDALSRWPRSAERPSAPRPNPPAR